MRPDDPADLDRPSSPTLNPTLPITSVSLSDSFLLVPFPRIDMPRKAHKNDPSARHRLRTTQIAPTFFPRPDALVLPPLCFEKPNPAGWFENASGRLRFPIVSLFLMCLFVFGLPTSRTRYHPPIGAQEQTLVPPMTQTPAPFGSPQLTI